MHRDARGEPCTGKRERDQQAPIVDRSTLNGKHIVGYQGWFRCPKDDFRGRWERWFRGEIDAGATFDAWPDITELSEDERCPTGLVDAGGKPLFLFASLNEKTVDRHLAWMAEYDIDGPAVQRFLTRLRTEQDRRNTDLMLRHVRASAARHRRVYFVMYDISGGDAHRWAQDLLADWRRLVKTERLTEDAHYLHHRGRPVIGIWGFGVPRRPGTPDEVASLIRILREHGIDGVTFTILGGVTDRFRHLSSHGADAAAWDRAFSSLWFVGRVPNVEAVEDHRIRRLAPDTEWARRRGIDSMPVICPGFSWANLRRDPKIENQIPRACGEFYRAQARAASAAGARMIYTAMFDEVDEATAIFKLVPKARDVPADLPAVTLDEEATRNLRGAEGVK